MGSMYLKGAIVAAFIFISCQFANAQQSASYLQEVLVPEVDTNLSQMVLGGYNYQSGVYERFDTLSGTFTNDAVIDEDTLYINSGTMGTNENIIYKYNLDNRQLIDTLHAKGASSFSIKDNHLIVSKGFPLDSNYVDIYDKRDFSKQYTGDTLDNYGSNIAISGNTAYVGRSEAFSDPVDTTKIFAYDLQNHSFDREIVLDTLVKDVSQLYTDDDFLYAFGDGYLTTYDLAADTFSSQLVSAGSSCFGDPFLGFQNGNIFYGTNADSIFSYDTANKVEALVSDYGSCFNTGRFDTLNDQFVVTRTDFQTSGDVKFVNRSNGSVTDSFSIGHSNESLALHYARNESPVVNDDFDTTKQGQSVQVDVLANDNDPDGDSLTLAITNNPTNGTASINAGAITYTADSNFTGTDSLTYEVCDVSPASLCQKGRLFVQVDSVVTSVQEQAPKVQLATYPNPTSDELQIRYNSKVDDDANFVLTTLRGRKIQTGRIEKQTTTLDISSLASGVYLLQVQQRQRSATQKVVIE